MADATFPPEPATGAPLDLLLTTKLHVPLPAPTRLRRPRLLELVSRGLRGPLTLVAAPAGWGKTTLLSGWCADAAGADRAVAWLSLEPGDNDPARFWTYLIAALQTTRPTLGAAAGALLRAPRAPPLEGIITTILNDLASLGVETVLIIDDYHVIEQTALHRSLAFFLDHLPPRLHLALATRADPPLPLARWRARGALVELRAADLRFTPDEASAFLGQVLGLTLDPGTTAALEARTEGWIAGLQLAALAMRDQRDIARFVESFTGSHRFVADYLAEEVLQHQPAAVQEFLLRTSILDRMCAALCQALGDDTAPHDAQGQLEQLERANLFLTPLDGERRWYRYHHLFADLLRARLQQERPELVRPLHQRASAWFERAGLVRDAIQHSLAAGDFARTAALLEPVADPLVMGGQMATVKRWLDQLPAHVLRSHPRLLIVHAAALHLLEARPLEAVGPTLRAAEAALGESDPARPAAETAELDRLAGRLAAIRAWEAGWEHGTQGTMALAQEALEHIGSDDPVWRAIALSSMGMGRVLRGEAVAATGNLSEAIQLALAAGVSYVAQGAMLWLASAHVARGNLREARATYHQGLDLAHRQGGDNLPLNAGLLIGLGCWVDYEWNDLEAAERHLEMGIRLAGPQLFPYVLVDAYATLARINVLRGDGEAAGELLRRMAQHAQSVENPWAWMVSRLAASMVRAYLAAGQVERAAEWAARLDTSVPNDLVGVAEFQRMTAARLLVARGRPALALRELDVLVRRATAGEAWSRVIEMEALRAVALDALGRREEALGALGSALARAEPSGYVRRFLDEGPAMERLLTVACARGVASRYADRLLRAFGAPIELAPIASIQAPSARPTEPSRSLGGRVEPLTGRERDVLRLLLAGRSGPEIADVLVVAPSTVRTHLKSLYGKLGAHSRDQAIVRARSLKLV